jgi:hypothetical protein
MRRRAVISQRAPHNSDRHRYHPRSLVACGLCVSVTATFRVFYLLVVMEHEPRRILHSNATAHPTTDWMLKQFREAFTREHEYRFLIDNCDGNFTRALEKSFRNLRLRILRNTPSNSASKFYLRTFPRFGAHGAPRSQSHAPRPIAASRYQGLR